jgi:hypothetical protein
MAVLEGRILRNETVNVNIFWPDEDGGGSGGGGGAAR